MRLTLFALVCLALVLVAGAGLGAPPPPKTLIQNYPLSYSPGWTTEGAWAWGQPAGAGGDPSSGHTSPYVYGYNLSGTYPSNMLAQSLTTTAIDCSTLTNTELRFWRWLGVESNAYDHAAVQVSDNGSSWTTIWANGSSSIQDASWSQWAFDISAVADGKATVYVRWVMGPSDFIIEYSGWNIDDVQIWADSYAPPLQILLWLKYLPESKYALEYKHTLDALASYVPNFVATESFTTEAATLEAELQGKRVFLMVEPASALRSDLEAAGTAFAPVLQDFVQKGGTAIVCSEVTYAPYGLDQAGFLNATGLMTAETAKFYPAQGASPLPVVEPTHPLATGLGATAAVADSTAAYAVGPSDVVSVVEDSLGNSVVACRDIGYGAVVLNGYDYWSYNSDAARIIANAVQYPRSKKKVLIYDGGTYNHSAVESASRLGQPNMVATLGDFNTLLAGSPWDLVVVEYVNAAPSGGWDSLASYLAAGGRVAFSGWNLDPATWYGPSGAIFGVSPSAELFAVPPITLWDPGNVLFNDPMSVPDLVTWDDPHFIRNGNKLTVTDVGAEAPAGYTATPTAGEAALVRGNGGRSIYNGFLWDDRNQDADLDGIQDSVELVMNEMVALLRTPEADFDASVVSGGTPLVVSFTDLSSNIPTEWLWDFGDGGTSTAQNPNHQYAAAGDYTVTLTASNAWGSDTVTKTAYIHTETAPAAAFSATPVAGPPGVTVSFTDLSTNAPTSWAWIFGDGGTATTKNPTHQYMTPGSYTVSLTATNLGGFDTETKASYITVMTPPTADFEATPTEAASPADVAFTDSSSHTPASWSWSFGDGGASSAQNPSHEYQKPGFYDVSLTATNLGGPSTKTKVRYIAIGFPDAGPGFWAFRPIIACYTAGIVKGYDDGNYRPSIPVTRDQMAVYISRALLGGDGHVPSGPAVASFLDVPTDHWAYKYVESAKLNNIVTGYGGGEYRPDTVVDRGQMAVFIARAVVTPTGDAGLVSYLPPVAPDFPDVPTAFWSYKYIEYCFENNIVKGYEDGYHPDHAVTRDQMAVYVQRAFKLPID